MATARDVVVTALRLLGAVASGEEPTADEARDGLVALNHMLHAWKARGVDIGHADLALTDAVSLADEQLEGAAHLLALRLAPEYQRDLSPALVQAAAAAWAAIQMAYAAPTQSRFESGMARSGSRRRGTRLT